MGWAMAPNPCPQSSKAAENQYYIHVAASETTTICQNRSAILRANAPNYLPLYLPKVPKAVENQYYIHVAEAETSGYFPDSMLGFAGGCPEGSAACPNP